MKAEHLEALQDLLSVKSLGDVTPVRVQRWQEAARAVTKDATADETPSVAPAEPLSRRREK